MTPPGGTPNLDLTNLSDIKLTMNTGKSFAAFTAPLEANLGLPGLGIQTTGSASSTLSYAFNFGVELDGAGFYLNSANPGFNASLDTKIPGFSASAHLGPLRFTASDSTAAPTRFNGTFFIALKDPNNDGHLRAGELGGDLLDATLAGNAGVHLHLASDLGTAVLPDIGADLNFDWGFNFAVVNPAAGQANFGNQPAVAFKNVSLGLGSFFSDFVSPIFDKLQILTAPLQPLVDVLTTEIKPFTDIIGSPVTIRSIAEVTGALDQSTRDQLDLYLQLIPFINSVPGGVGNARIDLGDYNLGIVDVRSPAFLLADSIPAPIRNALAAGAQSPTLQTFLNAKTALPGGGLSFPIIENPATALNLLLGKPVDFFTYHVPGLDFGPRGFDEFYPILGPLGVRLQGTVEAHAHLDVGYDSTGVAQFAGSGAPGDIFKGFFVVDQPGAEATVTGHLAAYGAFNVVFAEAGVGGGLDANLNVFLNDNDSTPGDGRVHLADLMPGCLFSTSGELGAGVSAYLTVGWGPFSETFEKNFAHVTLLDFSGIGCDPNGNAGGVVLAHVLGANVALHVGPDAAQRVIGDTMDNAEDFFVFHVSGGAGNDRLIGGAGNDALFGDAGVDLLVGGAGNDAQGDTFISIERIVGSPFADVLLGGSGNDNLGGGAGGDVIDGAGGDDLLTGDAGADQLTGGAGNDFAAYTISPAAVSVSLFTGLGSGGDAAGDTLSGIENLQGSSDFGDTLEGDNGPNWLRGLNASDPVLNISGTNTLRGLGGADLLEGGRDNDSLDGGDGADTLKASQDPASIDPNVSGGIDTLLGGNGNDLLYGDAGGDVLDGGADADQIYGGKDGDTIFGGTGDDLVFGGAGNDVIDGGEGANTLSGDDGNDTITAGSGANQMFGGAGNDVLIALAGNDALNGGDGNDQLNAGYGANVLNGDAGADILISGSGADTIHGGTGDDTATSGAGNDLVFGDDGNDTLDAGIGADRVEGGIGNDFLSVGALRALVQDPDRLDHLFGGAGIDTISADFSNQTIAMIVTAGQTQSLVFADGAETRDFENVHDFFTGSGNDVLHLDGAADDGFGNLLKTSAGNDVIFSGAGNDNVDAGDGDDFVNGGSNLTVLTSDGFGGILGGTPGDTLAGGAGNDTISFDQIFQNVAYQGAGGGIFRLGVYVNLATNETGNAAAGTVISGFENIIGTDFADILVGDDGPNVLMPLRGGGLYSGSTSGPDQIDGRGGIDTLRIDFSLADLPEGQGVFTSGGGFYRSSINAPVDSYSYANIERLEITGASKNDVIYPVLRGGDDILSGMGGNDTLGGFGGSDILLGGDGDDVLLGQGQFLVPSLPQYGYDGIAGGHDVFNGGAGDDLVEDIAFQNSAPLLGADALFQLDGGSGFDTLSADFSNQTVAIIWDSAAPVNLEFSDGAFARNFEALRYFSTGGGNDSITQRGRVDNLFYLGAGNDTVNPGLGVDTVDGGAGYDVAVLDFSIGDTAEVGGVTGYGNPDGGTYFRPLAADFFNRPDNIYLRNFESVHITGTSKNDDIAGTYGDDVILGGAGNDTLNGNRAGNSYLDGGTGDDTLLGAYPNYNGPGTGGGNDTLLGGTGNDTIFANHGSDMLMGGDGNDVISAGDRNGFGGYEYGVDVIDGGAGDDVVIDLFQYTFASAATRLKLDGGAGFDTLSAEYGNEIQPIIFVSGQSNSVDFADGSYFRNFERLGSFISGSGNDTLIALPGRTDNFIAGGAGDDVINPGLGIDTISGGPGIDLAIVDWSVGDDANVGGVTIEGSYTRRRDLDTGAIIDSVIGDGFERVQLTGGSKADQLLGGDLNDKFYGNAGNDTIEGNGGDDLLDGGPGADTMTGGAGNDTYYVDNIADIINEGAGGGYDTVIYTVGGSFTQPANIEKIIFLQSVTLPSLNIGPGQIVIVGGPAPAPAPPAIASDSGVNEIARLQAMAGTPTDALPIKNSSAAHDTTADIPNPTAAFHETFAPDFATDADLTHDAWLHYDPHAPFDFDVIDAMV